MKICRSIVMSVLVLLGMVSTLTAAPLPAVGLQNRTAMVAARGASVTLTVWYPARADGVLGSYGGSPIFKGVPVRRNASPAAGRFPVVVIAHGGLRANPVASGWIAAALAARGYVVVVVQPPRWAGSEAALAVRDVWLRPADLSAALDAVATDPLFVSHADVSRVAVLGFFLGGTSALAVAGWRLDPVAYAASCDPPHTGPDCQWFAQSGVDLHQVDAGLIGASHRDPRVVLAVAVNPELTDSLRPAQPDGQQAPAEIITLGQTQAPLPGVPSHSVPEANPFSAFSLCTPDARALLRRGHEDDAICRDDEPQSRADSHARMAALIETALKQGLPTGP